MSFIRLTGLVAVSAAFITLSASCRAPGLFTGLGGPRRGAGSPTTAPPPSPSVARGPVNNREAQEAQETQSAEDVPEMQAQEEVRGAPPPEPAAPAWPTTPEKAAEGLEFRAATFRALPRTSEWSWTGGGCEVGGGRRCDFDYDFALPATHDYCRHSIEWAKGGPNTRGFWLDALYKTSRGVHITFHAVGGPPWDRYGAGGQLGRVVVIGIPVGTPNDVRRGLGCEASADAVNACACVSSGGDISAILSCLAGAGGCDRISDMTYQSCVPDPQTCSSLQQANCSNEFQRVYDYVFVPNSPQCYL